MNLTPNYRHFATALLLRAIEDLALARSGSKIISSFEKGSGEIQFGKIAYPKTYFIKRGLTVKDDALPEIIEFFQSEYCNELLGHLGFKLKGETILRRKNLARLLLNKKDVRFTRTISTKKL